jgi:protein tyrosine phosphatase
MSNTILGLIAKPADLILPATRTQGALYLGSVDSLTPEFIKQHKIGVIISMTRVKPVTNALHFQYRVADHRSANTQMQSMLPIITATIDAHRKSGHNVLVHCYAGVHRAPTVVAHYLQRYEGHTVRSAVNLIRSARFVAFFDGNNFDLQARM